MQYVNSTWVGGFNAMASPCEVIVDCDDALLAKRVWQVVHDEALRIEHKFSRYRKDNIIHNINNSQVAVTVDDETALLLDYAGQCYELSDGLFDVSSGVLREVWRFDGSDKVPSQKEVAAIVSRVGWEKIQWQTPQVTVPAKMQVDLGGIGKEYAVDRAVALIKSFTDVPCLINFGGDIAVSGSRRNNLDWVVGVEDASKLSHAKSCYYLKRGAIATSGDAKRHLLKDGIRYSHILNPKTGWPVVGGPSSVTVFAPNCTEAGMFATFAMLQGAQAETFLQDEEVHYQIQWPAG